MSSNSNLTYRNSGQQRHDPQSTIFSCDLEEIEDERPPDEVKVHADSCKLVRHQRVTKITVPPKTAEHKLIGRVDESKRKFVVTKFEDEKINIKNSLLTTEKTTNYPVVRR